MELPKRQFMSTDSLGPDPPNDDLICSPLWIDIKAATAFNVHSVFDFEFQIFGVAAPDNPVDLRVLVLERQIDMSRTRFRHSGDFACHPDRRKMSVEVVLDCLGKLRDSLWCRFVFFVGQCKIRT